MNGTYRVAHSCIPCQNQAARTGRPVVCPHYFVAATCAEVKCPHYLFGWTTTLPADSEMVEWVRQDKTRHYSKQEFSDGGLVTFTFPAGQTCYRMSQHRRLLERGGTYAVERQGQIREYEFERFADEWNENALKAKGG